MAKSITGREQSDVKNQVNKLEILQPSVKNGHGSC